MRSKTKRFDRNDKSNPALNQPFHDRSQLDISTTIQHTPLKYANVRSTVSRPICTPEVSASNPSYLVLFYVVLCCIFVFSFVLYCLLLSLVSSLSCVVFCCLVLRCVESCLVSCLALSPVLCCLALSCYVISCLFVPYAYVLLVLPPKIT
jgi:hypothetical protein